MTRIFAGSATDLGKREVNEDSLLAVISQDASSGAAGQQSSGGSALLIVADGMGGRARGQLASRTAIKTVYKELAHVLALRADCDRAYLEESLKKSVASANYKIREVAKDQPGSEGMGTTCIAAVVMKGRVMLAHVGDTRAYLYHPGSHIVLLTEDHSIVGGEVRAGRLSENEARKSKFRNVITRAIGVEETIEADIVDHRIDSGDILVICSDGLHGTVEDAMIERILREVPDEQAAADRLVSEAKDNGAKDNISVIVARIEGDDVVINDPASPADASTEESKNENAESGRSLGNVIAFIVGILIIGLALWLVLPSFVSSRMPGVTVPVHHTAPAPPAPLDLSLVNYAAPEQLLGRPVLGNVLLRADSDMIVADPATHSLLRVHPNGFVATSLADTANLASSPTRSTSWASDPQGNLYETQIDPPTIKKFKADGTFIRTIAQGIVKGPTAVTVEPNGDVFVIDKGILTRIKAVAGPSAAPQTAPATSRPNSS